MLNKYVRTFLNDYRKSLWRIDLTNDVYIILFYYRLQMDQVSYCLSLQSFSSFISKFWYVYL